MLRTSCLLSIFYHSLYRVFPFSTCWYYPCCTLSFIDLLPCIPLSTPALLSQIPTDPYQLVSAMSHKAEHLQWEPCCLANFLQYKCIVLPFSSAHFLDLLLQFSSIKPQTHSHSHLFATFGSFLRPSHLLQPPLQLLHWISPSSFMRKMTNYDLPLPVALLCFLFPSYNSFLILLSHRWNTSYAGLFLHFFYLPLSQSHPIPWIPYGHSCPLVPSSPWPLTPLCLFTLIMQVPFNLFPLKIFSSWNILSSWNIYFPL